MRLVFDIEAVEKINSNLNSNHLEQMKQLCELRAERNAIATAAWHDVALNRFSTALNMSVLGNNGTLQDYFNKICDLKDTAKKYSEAKDKIKKLSSQLLNFNVQYSAYWKKSNMEFPYNERSYLRNQAHNISEFINRINNQINRIRDAWKDGDQERLINALETARGCLYQMMRICNIIASC